MTLPYDPQRALSGDGDYLRWRRSVDRLLGALDARIASSRAGRTGTASVWLGGALPTGLLAANGTVVARADYPALFAVIGTAYNTGGETGAQFRLPNLGAAPAGVWTIQA